MFKSSLFSRLGHATSTCMLMLDLLWRQICTPIAGHQIWIYPSTVMNRCIPLSPSNLHNHPFTKRCERSSAEWLSGLQAWCPIRLQISSFTFRLFTFWFSDLHSPEGPAFTENLQAAKKESKDLDFLYLLTTFPFKLISFDIEHWLKMSKKSHWSDLSMGWNIWIVGH